MLNDLKARDTRDAGRADSPLRPAADAHLLDTTSMGISDALERARRHIDAALHAAGDARSDRVGSDGATSEGMASEGTGPQGTSGRTGA